MQQGCPERLWQSPDGLWQSPSVDENNTGNAGKLRSASASTRSCPAAWRCRRALGAFLACNGRRGRGPRRGGLPARRLESRWRCAKAAAAIPSALQVYSELLCRARVASDLLAQQQLVKGLATAVLHGLTPADLPVPLSGTDSAAPELRPCAPLPGWYADPKLWRRNTAIAFAAMFAIAVPVFLHSAKLEQHHQAPVRPIPSQRWCKNFPPAAADRIGGAA